MITNVQRRARGALVSIPIFTGCAALPTHRWVDPETALSTMEERAAQIKTLSGPGDLALTNERGETVRLEAALAARFPRHMRLRAWKLGHVALDITLTPQGLWVMAGRDPVAGSELVGGLDAGRFMEAWAIATGGLFGRRDLSVEDAGGEEFAVVCPDEREGNRWMIRCLVERSTLTPRTVLVQDSAGIVHYTMVLDRYRSFDGLVWPTRMTGSSEHGSFVLEMAHPEFNEALAPAAFKPPPSAVRQSPWPSTSPTSASCSRARNPIPTARAAPRRFGPG